MANAGCVLVQTAAELRRRAGLTEPSFSTRTIIDECFSDTVVTGRRLPIGIHEVVSRTLEGPIIIYSRELSIAKQRFAIAHALAHLLFDGPDTSCGPGYVGCVLVEARADRFAEELLVPLEMLREYVGRWPSNDNADHELYLDQCDEIASHFNVPSYVVDKRIRELMEQGEEP